MTRLEPILKKILRALRIIALSILGLSCSMGFIFYLMPWACAHVPLWLLIAGALAICGADFLADLARFRPVRTEYHGWKMPSLKARLLLFKYWLWLNLQSFMNRKERQQELDHELEELRNVGR